MSVTSAKLEPVKTLETLTCAYVPIKGTNRANAKANNQRVFFTKLVLKRLIMKSINIKVGLTVYVHYTNQFYIYKYYLLSVCTDLIFS
jgi:hypothetical protein